MAHAPTAAGICWDLSALYSSITDPRLDSDLDRELDRARAFRERYMGRVAELDAAGLLEALKESESISMESAKPGTYASLVFAADTSKPEHGALYQRMSERRSELAAETMFFELELSQAPEEWLSPLLEDEALAPYRAHIQRVRAMSPFMLTEPEEVLLERTSNVGSRAWVRLHEELFSTHVFRFTPPGGEEQEMNESEVLQLLRHEDRGMRIAAAASLSQGIAELERIIVFTYNTLLADKKLDDDLRGMDHPEQSRNLANELEKETVDIVMDLCERSSGVVARYYRAKRQVLGLPELTHVDRYAPLPGAEGHVEWPRAKEMVLKAFDRFSPAMKARAEEFFDKNWIEAEPRAGKRGGAFCSYITPDLHPVMLMSYHGKPNDVMTLAHELGHGVHASLSRAQTWFNFHGTLPLAELASIFAEMLVFDDLVSQASPQDKLSLYGEKVEGIFASVHRQSAMFRFERRCHLHRREIGELTPEEFRGYWQQEMQSMFEDSVVLGEEHCSWWTYVGHFFFAPFYVYAYAFGELLTLSVYQKAKDEGAGFADRYLDVLQRGGSESPYDLMARIGVDLRDPAFWAGGLRAVEALVGEFEAAQSEMGQ
jgi:oligoendopeptidase F